MSQNLTCRCGKQARMLRGESFFGSYFYVLCNCGLQTKQVQGNDDTKEEVKGFLLQIWQGLPQTKVEFTCEGCGTDCFFYSDMPEVHAGREEFLRCDSCMTFGDGLG